MSTENDSPEELTKNDHARRVRAMFAGIAGRYDLLNHLLSGNTDKRWRRRVVKRLGRQLCEGARVLDVACGTGDLTLALAEAGRAQIIGVDFCHPMLEVAARKTNADASSPLFVEGDALRLPFADEAFDAVTIAFGLRNLSSVEAGLKEMRRVLKRGGRLAVLEFSDPVVPGFRALFQFYFQRVLPVIGGIISGSRGAYTYLPASVARFPGQRQLAAMMRAAGYDEVAYENFTGGIAALHTARRP